MGAGLNGSTALRDLKVVDCALDAVPPLRCFSGLTVLALAGHDELHETDLTPLVASMPCLRVLDISRNSGLEVDASLLVELVQRCPTLRDVYFQPYAGDRAFNGKVGHALLAVQRQVPRVTWHLDGAPDYEFA